MELDLEGVETGHDLGRRNEFVAKLWSPAEFDHVHLLHVKNLKLFFKNVRILLPILNSRY
jgi:hypothetical protein